METTSVAEGMRGKAVLVTGGTDGIGKAAAVGLAEFGANVVVVGRDREKGEAALAEIRRRSGNPKVHRMVADLSVRAEVRRLADGYASRFWRLDVLVNNAGILLHERSTTADGLEATLAVNHLAPFLLTKRLLPLLKESAPARVVNVASGAHRWARLDLDDLQSEADYGGIRAYNRSKLAVVLFTHELARRLRGTGVVANAFDPGPVRTGLLGKPKGLGPAVVAALTRLVQRSPEEAARGLVLLATSPELGSVTGGYFGRSGKRARPSKASRDEAAALGLWEESERLLGLDLAPATPPPPSTMSSSDEGTGGRATEIRGTR